MPRRPTRFEILIPHLLKEAEADEIAEPPSGYTASGTFLASFGAHYRILPSADPNADISQTKLVLSVPFGGK